MIGKKGRPVTSQHPSQSRPNKYRPVRNCFAEGCVKVCFDDEVFCSKHWAMVPDDLKMELFNAYTPGQMADESMTTMVYLDAAMRCISYIAIREHKQGK